MDIYSLWLVYVSSSPQASIHIDTFFIQCPTDVRRGKHGFVATNKVIASASQGIQRSFILLNYSICSEIQSCTYGSIIFYREICSQASLNFSVCLVNHCFYRAHQVGPFCNISHVLVCLHGIPENCDFFFFLLPFVCFALLLAILFCINSLVFIPFDPLRNRLKCIGYRFMYYFAGAPTAVQGSGASLHDYS